MQTDALELANGYCRQGRAERLTWGVIELQVTDLDRAVSFWAGALGLHDRGASGKGVQLGTADRTLILLFPGATQAVAGKNLGLYHVAIGVPTQNEFSRIFARLVSQHIQGAAVDHLMSKAIYIRDPDGIEIEIAFETPERFGRFGNKPYEAMMYDTNGTPHSGREQLDVRYELRQADTVDLDAPIADDTFLAHVHFKVDNLEQAASWFEGIGFARNLMLHNFGMADLGAGAAYTHRVAMNVWSGPNLKPAPPDMAGLIHYTLLANDQAVLDTARGLTRDNDVLTGRDPTGTQMTLRSI